MTECECSPATATGSATAPTEAPRCRVGRVLTDNARGDVRVLRISDGRIPWPIGRRVGIGRGGKDNLVLTGALIDAVRRESNQAVAYWFGVGVNTVTAWRKALGVPRANEGTVELGREHFNEPWGKRVRRKGVDARRGKPRPVHVIEAMRKGRTGKPHSADDRAKMSAAQKRRTAHSWAKLWTRAEDRIVRTCSIAEAAERTGRTERAVLSRRHRLGLPDGRRRKSD